MEFAFTEEQEQLRRTIRDFLTKHAAESAVRAQMDTAEGYDPAVWRRMAQELGLQGLAVPEEYGGAGFGWLELAVVFEEMGRALLCAPFFSTVALAVPALLTAGDEAAAKELLPGIAAGETIATLAVTETDARWTAEGIATTAREIDGRWQLSGSKDLVLDGHVADLLLVVAATDAGPTLFAVSADAHGLARRVLSTLDQTRKLAQLTFDTAPARLVGTPGAAWPIVERVLDLALVALAAEQVGGAQRCLDMAVDYAKTRIQFGRPIGSFQAVKHKCADVLVDVESAKSAAYYAAWCATELTDELPAMASMAKAFCSEVYTKAAAENIQVHGGIGFTWEHPAHLYLKRAKSSELLFGDPVHHRARLADLIGV